MKIILFKIFSWLCLSGGGLQREDEKSAIVIGFKTTTTMLSGSTSVIFTKNGTHCMTQYP